MKGAGRASWFFLLLGVLVLAAIAIPFVYNVNQLLKREDYEAARKRWEETKLRNYDLSLHERLEEKGKGQRDAYYEIQVRNGEAVSVKQQDKRVDLDRLSEDRKRRLTVTGMFEKIGQDLEEESHREGRHNYMTAAFDKETGCPIRYVRRVRQDGTRLEWRIKLSAPELDRD